MKRLAVVTGANRGLGLETARELAKKGNHVVIAARDPDKAKKAAEALLKEGLEVSFFPLDVTNADSRKKFREHIESQYGRLDILVNNAGVLLDKADKPLTPELLQRTIETNVYGPFFLSQELAP